MSDTFELMNDLLVRRATEGLDPEESRRLDGLLTEHPGVDAEWVDRLIGEIDAASLASSSEPLSDGLRDAVIAAAPTDRVTDDTPSSTPISSDTANVISMTGRAPTSHWTWAGWAVAAMIAAVAFGPLLRSEGPSGPAASDPPGFAEVASNADAVVASWTAGDDVTGQAVSGEVVWSAARQEGVMRFRGLASNDPGDFQYQLWIFDAERDERFPVDGGVFDVPSGADEVEVVIRAKLDVAEATLFAVTVEEPGGVVVSSRERIATLAQLGQQ